ncbi:MAG: PTS transporter subunit EIIA [Gammaproteobacteria bacterium]|nr:PTS transporter subunit EIIA [Gammaproteobacteria bacterium]
MNLTDLVSAERTLCRVEARCKKHALEIVSELLASDTLSLTSGEIIRKLFQREKIGSTYLGNSLAIPHAVVTDLRDAIAAILILNEPIQFDDDQESPVSVILSVLVPEEKSDTYDNLVRRIAQQFSDSSQLRRIQNATDKGDVLEQLANVNIDLEAITGVLPNLAQVAT